MFFNYWIFLVLDSIWWSIENTSSTGQYPGAIVIIYIRNKQHAEAEKTGILTDWFVAGVILRQNPLLSASWSSCYCYLWCHHLTTDDTMVYYLSCIHGPMRQRAGSWENAGIPSDTWVKQETTLSSSSTEEVLEAPWEIPRSPWQSSPEPGSAWLLCFRNAQLATKQNDRWQAQRKWVAGGFEMKPCIWQWNVLQCLWKVECRLKHSELFLDSCGNIDLG